ncbi:MAG: Hsp20/alpha crystallin family protein [Burkholderiaceae bacterium]|nr:MAG: Hsp20/alpha crystallin family protein [Burkholderiaceae bacterium]
MNLITRNTNYRDPLTLFEDVFGDVFARPSWTTNEGAPLARARMDVTEKPEAFEVKVDLPGVKKDDIQVDIQGNRVAISAQVQTSKEQKDDRVLYSERYAASYARSFDLPQEVDETHADARYENGVLQLLLPKKATTANKRLAIK